MKIDVSDLQQSECFGINYGKYDDSFFNTYSLIRMIPKKYYKRCRNQLLLSSLQRNKEIDGNRGDTNEAHMKYVFDNRKKERYHLEGKDCEVIGLKPGVKFTGITGTGGVTFEHANISNNLNLHSLSFSYVPNDIHKNDKIIEITNNLHFDLTNYIVLKLLNPISFFQAVCEKLQQRYNAERFIAIHSMIRYKNRENNLDGLDKFMQAIIDLQTNLDMDTLFTKPVEPFEKDSEVRVIWIPINDNKIDMTVCEKMILLNIPYRSYFKIQHF